MHNRRGIMATDIAGEIAARNSTYLSADHLDPHMSG
jgi:hypothetical protein